MRRTAKIFIAASVILFALSVVKLGAGLDTDSGGTEKPYSYGHRERASDNGGGYSGPENAGRMRTAADEGGLSGGQSGYAYILKNENGRVMIYYAGNDRAPVETAISYPDLPPEDRALLDSGIAVENEQQLLSVIEDYTS